MTSDTVVRARIDAETKAEATEALAKMGLSVSDYIRMALVRVARDKAVPFPVKVPRAQRSPHRTGLVADYRIDGQTVRFERTGTHADLFEA